MEDRKTIYCPICGRRVSEWDERTTINVIVNCRKCRKRVIFHVDEGKTEVKNIPPRVTSSGMTFY